MSNVLFLCGSVSAVLTLLVLLLFREVLRLAKNVEQLDKSRAWHYVELSRLGYELSSLTAARSRSFFSRPQDEPAESQLPTEATSR